MVLTNWNEVRNSHSFRTPTESSATCSSCNDLQVVITSCNYKVMCVSSIIDITFLILTLLSFVSVHNSVFLGCKPCCKILCYKVVYYKVDAMYNLV